MMSNTATDLCMLPRLADPSGYRPCKWNLSTDPDKRAYWVGLFEKHFPSLIDEALREADDTASSRAAQASLVFGDYLEQLKVGQGPHDPLTVLDICQTREQILRDHGFDDPYRLAKERENKSAMCFLPQVLAHLDALSDAARHLATIQGVFAGNIFDRGATATDAMFKENTVDFHATRDKLKPRPWLVDDLDLWLARLAGPSHRGAVLFVDNAGPDVVLGMIPLARELLKRGTQVILAANTSPSLNDVTFDELGQLMTQAAGHDVLLRDAIAQGRLEWIASGCQTPLIDLRYVSRELADAVERRGVDLVILEGMGRALESNLEARFTCDVMKLCMIKDPGVANAMGGELFDLMFRFEPGR